jgi:hypothetical protein
MTAITMVSAAEAARTRLKEEMEAARRAAAAAERAREAAERRDALERYKRQVYEEEARARAAEAAAAKPEKEKAKPPMDQEDYAKRLLAAAASDSASDFDFDHGKRVFGSGRTDFVPPLIAADDAWWNGWSWAAEHQQLHKQQLPDPLASLHSEAHAAARAAAKAAEAAAEAAVEARKAAEVHSNAIRVASEVRGLPLIATDCH